MEINVAAEKLQRWELHRHKTKVGAFHQTHGRYRREGCGL